jgi:hypothetical protein
MFQELSKNQTIPSKARLTSNASRLEEAIEHQPGQDRKKKETHQETPNQR